MFGWLACSHTIGDACSCQMVYSFMICHEITDFDVAAEVVSCGYIVEIPGHHSHIYLTFIHLGSFHLNCFGYFSNQKCVCVCEYVFRSLRQFSVNGLITDLWFSRVFRYQVPHKQLSSNPISVSLNIIDLPDRKALFTAENRYSHSSSNLWCHLVGFDASHFVRPFEWMGFRHTFFLIVLSWESLFLSQSVQLWHSWRPSDVLTQTMYGGISTNIHGIT